MRSLAEPQDLAPFLGGAVVPEEKLAAALAAASSLVRSYTRQPEGWATGIVPDPVFQAVLFIARRVALMPEGATGDETVGPFSVKRDSSMWLSATEKILLAPFMGHASITTVTTVGPTGIGWPTDVLVPGDLPGSDPWLLTAEEVGEA